MCAPWKLLSMSKPALWQSGCASILALNLALAASVLASDDVLLTPGETMTMQCLPSACESIETICPPQLECPVCETATCDSPSMLGAPEVVPKPPPYDTTERQILLLFPYATGVRPHVAVYVDDVLWRVLGPTDDDLRCNINRGRRGIAPGDTWVCDLPRFTEPLRSAERWRVCEPADELGRVVRWRCGAWYEVQR